MENQDLLSHRVDLIPVCPGKEPGDLRALEGISDLLQDRRLLVPTKVPEGVIEQNEIWLCRHHPGEQGKDLLAPGEVLGERPAEAVKADFREDRVRLGRQGVLSRRDRTPSPSCLQGEGYIFLDGEPRKEGRVLGEVPDSSHRRRQADPRHGVKEDGPV